MSRGSSSHSSSVHSSASHATSSAGDGSPIQAGSASAGGKGFGVHPESLDSAGRKLDQHSSDLGKIASGIKGVNVGPQSFGVIGQAFAGGAKDHVQHTAQTVDHAAESVSQASTGVRKSADLYRQIEDGNHRDLSKIHFGQGAGKVLRNGSAANGAEGGPAATGSAGANPKSRSDDGNLQKKSGDPQTPNRDVNNRQSKSDPIDIASGEMILAQTDAEIAAALPLILRRTHLSSYRVGLGFGASWASTLDQRLEVGSAGVSFAADDGKLLFTPTPGRNATVEFAGSRNTLARHEDDSYTVTLVGEGHALYFAPGNGVLPLAAIIDRNGNLLYFDYDEAGVVAEIRHSGGYRIRVESADGLITALYLRGAGNGEDLLLMRYEYTERRLTAVVNASGQALRFSYDAAGRITGWTDRNDCWYRYTYDHEGRCIRTEGPGGFLTGSFEYANGVTRYTNSLGHSTSFYLNDKRQTVREVDSLGNETVSEWDDYDRLLSRTDALGRTTRYDYDDAGNLVSVTRPDGLQFLVEYNHQRLPVTFVDPDGAVRRNEYDERGNLTKVLDPAGAVTTYGYDERGFLARVTDALGNVRRIETDDAGLPVSVTNPLGATITYRRDGFGRVIEAVDPFGGTTRFGWTVDGKPAWRTLPDGATERWLYDGEGNLHTQVDQLGQTTRTEMTSFDLPAVEVGPDGRRLEFCYDTELRLVAVTNEQGLVWQYEYDPAGNLVRETDFDGRVVSYRFDSARQLVERTNGAGEAVRFTYDVLGNVIERRSGSATATFTYDAMGRLVDARDHATRVSFQRDPVGRVLTEMVNGRTVASVYDPLGRRVRRQTPSGAESVWEYDADDRPVALHTAGRTVRFDYDAAGREVRRTLGRHAVLSQIWNANHKLASQTLLGSAGHPLQQRSYTYRPDGVLAGIHDQLVGPRTFDLDHAGRVTGVDGPQWMERYVYDEAGNITTAHWPGAVDAEAIGERQYSGTRIRRAGGVRYEHDAQGRIAMRQRTAVSGQPETWRYFWDADDRLTSVLTPGGARWGYRYDPLGRRVAKQRLTPDGQHVLEQIDFTWDDTVLAEQAHHLPQHAPADGVALTVWDYEPGTFRPVIQHERGPGHGTSQQGVNERHYAVVTDLIGRPAELVDEQGNIAWLHRATLWGRAVDERGGGAYTPLRFPGQYDDPETGFHYNFHRHYDPVTGRYASHDPLGLAPAPNPLAYVPNPTTFADPLGLAPCKADYPHFINSVRQQFGQGRKWGSDTDRGLAKGPRLMPTNPSPTHDLLNVGPLSWSEEPMNLVMKKDNLYVVGFHKPGPENGGKGVIHHYPGANIPGNLLPGAGRQPLSDNLSENYGAKLAGGDLKVDSQGLDAAVENLRNYSGNQNVADTSLKKLAVAVSEGSRFNDVAHGVQGSLGGGKIYNPAQHADMINGTGWDKISQAATQGDPTAGGKVPGGLGLAMPPKDGVS